MFEHFDHIIDRIIVERICNYDNLKEGFKRTLPKTRERFKRSEEQVISSISDDLYFNLDYLKSELDSILLLLNPKGVRIFFDKLKQKLSFQDERQLTADIKLKILEGKEITPNEKPDVFAYIDSSYVLPYYEGIKLEFDLEKLTTQIVRLWLDYIQKVNEIVNQLEKEYSNPNIKKEDEILVLKPTIWGMSLNLNEIWKKYFKNKNGSQH